MDSPSFHPGLRLKLLRVACGVRQRELALQVGLSPSVLSDIEGGWRMPSAEEIAQICKALQIDPERFERGGE